MHEHADTKTDPEERNEPLQDPKHGDLLLVDLLHPDLKHFFSRYRVDLIGFAVVSLIVVFIIVATKWLVMIGADSAGGSPG